MLPKLLRLLPLVGLALAHPGEKGFVPTASGQIGVNPVSYLGSDTLYFSDGSSTTSWIGSGSAFPATITDTAGNVQTTAVAFGVVTATANSGTESVGDLNFVISPEGSTFLENLFQEISTACPASKLKSRDETSCVANYVNQNGPPVASFSDRIAAALPYIGDAQALQGAAAAGFAVAVAVAVNSYFLWANSQHVVPTVIKIPAKNIGTGMTLRYSYTPRPTLTATFTSSTSTSSSSSLDPAPYVTVISESPGPALDTPSASVLDLYLQQKYMVAAATTASPSPSPSSSATCTCTDFLIPIQTPGGGFSTSLNCPDLSGGGNCALVTATQTPQPSPSPPSSAACNSDRSLPAFITPSQTINTVAASAAAESFCKAHSYTVNDINCPASNSYPFSGDSLDGDQGGTGAAGGLGTISRIYLATRWSLADCDPKFWLQGEDGSQTYANAYVTGPTYVEDCMAGFNAAIASCPNPSDSKSSLGSYLQYNCMDFLVFASTSALLDLANNVGGGCSIFSW